MAATSEAQPDAELSRDELAALLDVNQALSAQRDREALGPAVARATAHLVPADRVFLAPGAAFPEGSVAAAVAGRREAVVVSAFDEIRERFPETYRLLADEGMQSAAVVPLVARERCLGVLGFLARDPGAFD